MIKREAAPAKSFTMTAKICTLLLKVLFLPHGN